MHRPWCAQYLVQPIDMYPVRWAENIYFRCQPKLLSKEGPGNRLGHRKEQKLQGRRLWSFISRYIGSGSGVFLLLGLRLSLPHAKSLSTLSTAKLVVILGNFILTKNSIWWNERLWMQIEWENFQRSFKHDINCMLLTKFADRHLSFRLNI